jgi:hypothetical protein
VTEIEYIFGMVQKTVKDFRAILEKLSALLYHPNGRKLSTSQELVSLISGCLSELQTLEKRLKEKGNPGKKENVMRQFGFRALKWPLVKKDVEKTIDNLERYKQMFLIVLQVDQTLVLCLLPRIA